MTEYAIVSIAIKTMPNNAQKLIDHLVEITKAGSSGAPNRSCRQRLAGGFGILAWFLLPEFRHRVQQWIREDFPDCSAARDWQLPRATGACPVPVVWRDVPAGAASPAAILPLRWAPEKAPEGSIPNSLLELSKTVRQMMAESRALQERAGSSFQLERWQLNWAVDAWRDWQLGDLAVSPESAFAPLAMGLVCAALNIAPAADFIATGQWDIEKSRWAIQPRTLEPKLKAAFDLGFRRFVVPPTEENLAEDIFSELEEDSGEQPQWLVLPKPKTETELGAALLNILPLAGAQPTARDRLEDRATWYDSLASQAAARTYFETHILPDISRRGRQQLESVDPDILRPDALVSIYSGSEDLLWLTAVTWMPRRLVYVCTEDFAQRCEQFVERLKQRWDDVVTECDRGRLTDDGDGRSTTRGAGRNGNGHGLANEKPVVEIKVVARNSSCLPQLEGVRRSFAPDDGQRLVIDATPGRRAMQISLTAGAKPGDLVFCWWHSTSRATRRAVPLDTRPVVWQVDQSRELRCKTESLQETGI